MIYAKVKAVYGKEKDIMIAPSEALEPEAEMACKMIERWGMVAAIEDGEDSAGRQKLRLATPEELVSRAFAVAKLVFSSARENGLFKDMTPLLDEVWEANQKRHGGE
jgi:hypothetical protein